MDNNYILTLKNITKEFPGVKALDDVTINIERGTIHGLVGENGAGKSTLIKVLAGKSFWTASPAALTAPSRHAVPASALSIRKSSWPSR